MYSAKKMNLKEIDTFFQTLNSRFANNMDRHKKIEWTTVINRLESNPEKVEVLNKMEATGGEPDVVGIDKQSAGIIFYDCSVESPKGRRSLCYDHEALISRKKNKPLNNALDMAESIGIELLTEDQYRQLQQLGSFDLKTSSWIKTPTEIRKLGGALFCDRRYGHVFVYHNGADSYYSVRGFRGSVTI
jgi:hypothetical protein